MATATSTTSSQANVPSSSHRLPTQSASDALRSLREVNQSAFLTGLSLLDQALKGSSPSAAAGLQRGKITELWGPSGAGKTLLAVQAAHECIKAGNGVIWIDAAKSLSDANHRFMERSSELHTSNSNGAENDKSPNFVYQMVQTFPHLLALVLHPPPSLFGTKSKLLVIDGVNALVDRDYPRNPFLGKARTDQQKWQAGRRYAVLGSLVAGLNKLAALRGLAIVVTTGSSPRSRTESSMGAALAPGIGGAEWEAGVWNRIVLFRDYGCRFAGVQKSQGKHARPADPVGAMGILIPFQIDRDGRLIEIRENSDVPTDIQAITRNLQLSSSPVKSSRKRAYDEVADSDEEEADEYGWQEADELALTQAMADGTGIGEIVPGVSEDVISDPAI